MVGLQEVFIHPFGRIVDAAVGSVQEQVDEGAVAGDEPHLIAQGPHEFVFQQGVDGVVHAGPQVERVEFGNRGSREHPVPEPALTVFAPEIQAERVLALGKGRRVVGVETPDVIPAGHPDAGIDLESAVVFGADPFHRDRALPGQSVVHRVAGIELHDPGAAIEVVGGGHQGDHRQQATRGRKIVEVGVGLDAGRDLVGGETHGTDHSVGLDGDGLGVGGPVVQGRDAAVGGVADGHPGLWRGDRQPKGHREEAARHAEVQVRDGIGQGTRSVGRRRCGRGEEAELPGRGPAIQAVRNIGGLPRIVDPVDRRSREVGA